MVKTKISTLPIIAKILSVSGFAASVLLNTSPANAIDFNFRFQDTSGTNGFIEGTLTGLQEGQNFFNNPGGITATITSTPNGDYLGSYFLDLGGYYGSEAFIVTNGVITSASAQLANANFDTLELSFGTGSGTAIYEFGSIIYEDSTSSTTQFTAATPVPFESSPIALPASLAMCFGVAKFRKKHLDKKRQVSVDA
jgi:hypothetical protein